MAMTTQQVVDALWALVDGLPNITKPQVEAKVVANLVLCDNDPDAVMVKIEPEYLAMHRNRSLGFVG